MLAQRPPMGWNTWNTFGKDISDSLLRETIDIISEEPYRQAGYEYVVIDDCWAKRERNAQGLMEVDPEKFPHGMKSLADYAHQKGLKLGLYSCAGVRTCGGYPGSFDHEYEDARTFAEWGIDYLKYDFCNFPVYGDNMQRYLTMSMALRASGRDILFSACNWGRKEPWNWMRSIGAHMYRSDTDIRDNFVSTADIMRNQFVHLNGNAPGCFNDLDMLTVGMEGCGHAAVGQPNSWDEYETQFAFWCLCGAPLIMGCDVRKVSDRARDLLTHAGLLAINQDPLCLPPYIVQGTFYDENIKMDTYILMKLLDKGEFAIGFFNLNDTARNMECIFGDCGIPYASGRKVALWDVMQGSFLGEFQDDVLVQVRAHHCRVLKGRVMQA